MRRVARIAAALSRLACIAGAARTASAATLDPFRTGGAEPRPARVARSVPASRRRCPCRRCRRSRRPGEAGAERADDAEPAADAQRRRRAPKACQKDEDCADGNICQANVCQAIELSTNLFPIYYREGLVHRRSAPLLGAQGRPRATRVVFPFYWHF